MQVRMVRSNFELVVDSDPSMLDRVQEMERWILADEAMDMVRGWAAEVNRMGQDKEAGDEKNG